MQVKKTLSLALAALCLAGLCSVALAAEEAERPVPVQEILADLNASGGGAIFPIGKFNAGYAAFFTGNSYLASITTAGVPMNNVTFHRGAHTFWHVHNGTCQMLYAVSGSGYYQIWGEEPHQLRPGDRVTIPANVKHWHGAAPGKTFQHLVMMEPGGPYKTDWLEPVDDSFYQGLK